ncbi:MAG: aldo/keto reductase [Saprospiraceae bacterium]|nr:aldo/keto reductase [Saprospiraceae bacterium]
MNQTTTLGNSTLNINRIGLGCMGMSEFYRTFDENESIKTLHKAIDLGVNFFFDTADMYGWGANEKLIGRALGKWSQWS